jgi:hypothetical protein
LCLLSAARTANKLFWNARGISNKSDEFLYYVEANNILLELGNKTYLQPFVKQNCPNYLVYKKDREDRPSGKTAILVMK